jgi:hypothetical protein
MVSTETTLENLTLNIEQEIHVNASLETTFEALLEELASGPQNNEGVQIAMKLEPWPGGRWFRDLGNQNGHWWGAVQAIKRPTLLEISGPLFMSYPVSNNLQYRLSEEKGGTLIKFHHTGFGLILEDHKKGVSGGWKQIHERIQKRADAIAAKGK